MHLIVPKTLKIEFNQSIHPPNKLQSKQKPPQLPKQLILIQSWWKTLPSGHLVGFIKKRYRYHIIKITY